MERKKKKKMGVKLAAANGSDIRVEGEAKLRFRRNGKQCEMDFLDADVKRPLGAVSAIVDAANIVIFSRAGSYILHEEAMAENI